MSRRRFLELGAATGVGAVAATAITVGVTSSSEGSEPAAATNTSTEVIVVDRLEDIPPGTRAGTLVVVRT